MKLTVQYDRDPGLDSIWYGRRLETVRVAIADDGSMTETVEHWTGAPSSVNHYLLPVDAHAAPTDAQRAAIHSLAAQGHRFGYELLKWLEGPETADRTAALVHGDNLAHRDADATEAAVEATAFDRRERHYPEGA